VDREAHPRDEQVLRDFAERYFPDGAGPTMTLKACLFTNTPDNHFVIDLYPGYPQVSLAAGFSGHGFKFVSVIGEIMADLAERGSARHTIELFRLERFTGRPGIRQREGHTPARHGLDRARPEAEGWVSTIAAEGKGAMKPFW
jgi:sarcosine oxidase